jgi:hypothetical protein
MIESIQFNPIQSNEEIVRRLIHWIISLIFSSNMISRLRQVLTQWGLKICWLGCKLGRMIWINRNKRKQNKIDHHLFLN